MKYVVYSLLAAAYILHTDVWLWDEPRLVLGLPAGFTYHIGWMVAVTGILWLAVRYAWPAEIEAAAERDAASAEREAAAERGAASAEREAAERRTASAREAPGGSDDQ